MTTIWHKLYGTYTGQGPFCPSHIMDVSTLPGLSDHDVTNCNKGQHETFNSWLSNCKPKEDKKAKQDCFRIRVRIRVV